MFETIGPPPLKKGVGVLLTMWCIFIPVWLLLSMAAGAYRTHAGGNLFLISWALYPVLLFLAFFFKRSRPYLTLLPILSVGMFIVSEEVENLLRHT